MCQEQLLYTPPSFPLPLSQVRNEFYKDAQGVLLVYDVTNRASFESLSQWMVEMKENLANPSEMDSIIFAVCANKARETMLRTFCLTLEII